MKILFAAMWVSFIVMLIWLYIFKKLWILDTPWKYKDLNSKTPVPSLMWIFLILATILSIVLLLPGYWEHKEIQALFAGAMFLGMIAVIDDMKGLSPKFSLMMQVLVAMMWILGWAIMTHINFFWEIMTLPYWMGFMMSLMWFVLMMNSFNWFDWMNWMGAWVATMGFFTIALVMKFMIFKYYQISPQELQHLMFILNLSLIMTWVSFVFTLMEMKPRGLLSDVGIMFLWYVLAYLSLFAWAKVWIMLVVLSLVIFDAFWVIMNRLKNKKNPMKWDYTHFHHSLMKHWWKSEEMSAFVRVWSLFFMILMILQWTNTTNKAIIFMMIFMMFFWTHIYMYWIKKLPVGLWESDENLNNNKNKC